MRARRTFVIPAIVSGLLFAGFVAAGSLAQADEMPRATVVGLKSAPASGVHAPVMFAIQRNYGPIEERSERIPVDMLTGGAAPIAPIGWGYGYGYRPYWYGNYYGPRYYSYYGYGAPYYSYYRPWYGYTYGPGYPYGYRTYAPAPYYGYRGYYW
ncbi:MAG: hypothetical protein K1X74_21420 [Pirellulales bacterium]|nr:hypothetical protein [Pirellulales bacterium]